MYVCMYVCMYTLISIYMYVCAARLTRHIKFLHKNPDVMIHIRAFEEYDGNQEKHGAKSFRDGVHTYLLTYSIHTCMHTYAYTYISRVNSCNNYPPTKKSYYIHTYVYTHAYIHTEHTYCTYNQSYIHTYTNKNAYAYIQPSYLKYNTYMHIQTKMHTYIHACRCI